MMNKIEEINEILKASADLYKISNVDDNLEFVDTIEIGKYYYTSNPNEPRFFVISKVMEDIQVDENNDVEARAISIHSNFTYNDGVFQHRGPLVAFVSNDDHGFGFRKSRLATSKEIQWLEYCIKEDRFVDLKDFEDYGDCGWNA